MFSRVVFVGLLQLFQPRPVSAVTFYFSFQSRRRVSSSSSPPINNGDLCAIVMDANGVLYRRVRKKLSALYEWLSQQTEYDSHFLTHRFQQCDILPSLVKKREEASTGYITAQDYYLAILNFLGVLPHHQECALEILRSSESNIKLFPTVRETLPILHQRGFKLGVITNSMYPTSEKLEWLRAQQLDWRWDCFVNSCEVGYEKPSPQIYRKALEILRVKPYETLFVGHSQKELIGAKQQGIWTALVNPDPDARSADFYLTQFADLLTLPCLLRAKSTAP